MAELVTLGVPVAQSLDDAFGTVALAAAQSMPAAMASVHVLGYSAPGDGGGALYARVGSEPAHALKFQSADGAWWEISPGVFGPGLAQCGAALDGTTDDLAALNRLIGWVNAKGTVAANSGRKIIIPLGGGECKVSAASDPILVSKVDFTGGVLFRFGDFALFTVGSSSALPQDVGFLDFGAALQSGVTPTAGLCAVVKIVQGAGILLDNLDCPSIGHLVYSAPASGKTVSGILVRGQDRCFCHPNCSGIRVDNTAGATVSKIELDHVTLSVAGSAVQEVPIAVTGVTRGATTTITAPSHGLLVGDKVRLRDFPSGSTVQLNDRIETVATVPDANTITLAVNSAAFTAWSSGGYLVELHASYGTGTAAIHVTGPCDTIRASKLIAQHWEYGIILETTSAGAISFVDVEAPLFDLIGESVLWINLNTNGIGRHCKIRDGEAHVYNGDAAKLTRAGSENVSGFALERMEFGNLGGGLLSDPGGMLIDPRIDGNEVYGSRRARSSTSVAGAAQAQALLAFGATTTSRPRVTRNTHQRPQVNYGTSANPLLVPDIGIDMNGTSAAFEIEGNDLLVAQGGTGYDIVSATAAGERRRFGRNSVRVWDGAAFTERQPENLTVVTHTLGSSPASITNHDGFARAVSLVGGTWTSATLSGWSGGSRSVTTMADGSDDVVIPWPPGETLTVTYSSAPTTRSAPLMI